MKNNNTRVSSRVEFAVGTDAAAADAAAAGFNLHAVLKSNELCRWFQHAYCIQTHAYELE